MAEADSSTEDPSTTSFPALTTTFTPPPECSGWYLDDCTDTGCYVQAFPTGRDICGSDGSGTMTAYACYPDVSLSTAEFANGQAIYTVEVATYSPGLYCPFGMSTATSVPLLDGVFCCPEGMRFQGGLEGGSCARTQTEGTFIVSSDCTRTTISKPTGSLTTTLSIYAMPVFLGGRRLASMSPSPTSSLTQGNSRPETPAPSSPISGDGNDGLSVGLKVGLGVGIPLGVVLLLAPWVYWGVRRYRQNKARKVQRYKEGTDRSTTSSESVEGGKPELFGSTPQSYVKAELDPLATRAELEAPVQENGASIFVHKPELQGADTSADRRVLGVYVRSKGELEAIAAGQRRG